MQHQDQRALRLILVPLQMEAAIKTALFPLRARTRALVILATASMGTVKDALRSTSAHHLTEPVPTFVNSWGLGRFHVRATQDMHYPMTTKPAMQSTTALLATEHVPTTASSRDQDRHLAHAILGTH